MIKYVQNPYTGIKIKQLKQRIIMVSKPFIKINIIKKTIYFFKDHLIIFQLLYLYIHIYTTTTTKKKKKLLIKSGIFKFS